MGTLIDITGQRFGRLVVVQRSPDVIVTRSRRTFGKVMWLCICDCGNEITVDGVNLRAGRTRSCGCLQKEKAAKICRDIGKASKHGDSSPGNNRLYNVWASMKSRCSNPNHHAYNDYGGRGITVCEDWKEYRSFKKWAMENGYNPDAERGQCTIDRINVNGNYCPENCRWVSMDIQNANKRNKNTM